MSTPKSKVFAGKRYVLYGTYLKESQANAMARRFRAGEEPARVVKDTNTRQWAVYVRYRKGRGPL